MFDGMVSSFAGDCIAGLVLNLAWCLRSVHVLPITW